MSTRLTRVHCSYHKCLTIYYSMVMGQLCNDWFPSRGAYWHFNSHLDQFYDALDGLRVASVNNHLLDLSRLGRFRLTRFVRDPRDLIVSGYHYHRRGAEEWCNIVNPTPSDWQVVNGRIPTGMRPGESYAGFLQRLPVEDGLIAEIEFRRNHFESMGAWPVDHPDILTLRYEEILGREVETIARILRFQQFSLDERLIGRFLAWRFSAGRQKHVTHIRNPKPNQWMEHFTPRVQACFTDHYPALVSHLGYPAGPLAAETIA